MLDILYKYNLGRSMKLLCLSVYEDESSDSEFPEVLKGFRSR